MEPHMKVISHLKVSSGLRALCLAVFAAIVVALTPRPAVAAHQVPFSARFTTEFTSSVEFPFATIMVTGSGHATHLGATTAATTDQTVNLITGAATATYTLTAANGDTLILSMEFQATFTPDGVEFEGTYVVVGGTGRFAHATGSGSSSGTATFTSPDAGAGSFTLGGSISYRGC
jgi:hypothetical protein